MTHELFVQGLLNFGLFVGMVSGGNILIGQSLYT